MAGPNQQVECVECGAAVVVEGKVLAGEVLACPECGVELEVTSIQPIKVQLAPEVEEDWGE